MPRQDIFVPYLLPSHVKYCLLEEDEEGWKALFVVLALYLRGQMVKRF